MPTISDIARDWGVTRQYVQQKVKQGCPTDTFENARLWKDAHASSKASANPRRVQKIIEEKEDDSPEARQRRKEFLESRETPSLPKELTIEGALINARNSASEAYRLLEEAMLEGKASKISPMLAIHNKALEALWKSEQSYREELERRKILIEVSEANETARKGWEIVVGRLASLPQNVAPRCNPHDPNHAMDILQQECAAIISDARKAFSQ